MVAHGLNVFDTLFFCSDDCLVIQNNRILCKYSKLPYWRQMTVELGKIYLLPHIWRNAVYRKTRSGSEDSCGTEFLVIIMSSLTVLHGEVYRRIIFILEDRLLFSMCRGSV